ncbi:hypothetical protein HYDPIDRAFT_189500 [Hydnomerulius pinastri MD-312]|uniref:Unplaced genomic scaffold scaffold_27, whole genome shotgun sequence n=1 Tax=Hydnomerulius pinastri MD-312 TaxID=994086 RepID=A0A0C9W4Y5_9AGAM|nr:hypothetical protein HYDPIDRAFT_189500 [Hydnomerulius pinastri MD-312]
MTAGFASAQPYGLEIDQHAMIRERTDQRMGPEAETLPDLKAFRCSLFRLKSTGIVAENSVALGTCTTGSSLGVECPQMSILRSNGAMIETNLRGIGGYVYRARGSYREESRRCGRAKPQVERGPFCEKDCNIMRPESVDLFAVASGQGKGRISHKGELEALEDSLVEFASLHIGQEAVGIQGSS